MAASANRLSRTTRLLQVSSNSHLIPSETISRCQLRPPNCLHVLRRQQLHAQLQHQQRLLQQRHLSTQSLPTILQPSFWRSLLPKALRERSSTPPSPSPSAASAKTKDWNPATYFIAIFLLIGSQSIQMISLNRSFDNFSNETEAKLALLREVIRRVQNGEDFDVKAALGTGDEAREKEWEAVLRELEEEDNMLARNRKLRGPNVKKRQRDEEERRKREGGEDGDKAES